MFPEWDSPLKSVSRNMQRKQWSWIKTNGPERIESDSNGTVEANITIPRESIASQGWMDYIKISSDNQTFEIPVSVAVSRLQSAGPDTRRRL